jgi:hypothetical protein
MISISRSLLRQFRAVARRAGLHKSFGKAVSSVRLLASTDAIVLQAENGHVAIEYRCPGLFEPADVTVPWRLLTDCEAKAETPLTIRVEDSSRILAGWDDRGLPQRRDYEVPASSVELPETPTEWATGSARLLVALREAQQTTDTSATRFALNCIQLRGATGTIAASDSRQLLIQSGFQFPWAEDLLMTVSDVFASREIPAEAAVEIGRTADWVTVRVGPWAIHHKRNLEGRFPNVDSVVPASTSITSRLEVDPADARFLSETVGRLPADDALDRPLTIELNGSVVVRARKDGVSPMTELLLSRSRRVGEQLRFQTNRRYLARALELGFTEIGFVDAKSPCVCRDDTRTYVWMLLEQTGALESSPEALRIDSSSLPLNGVPTGRGTNVREGGMTKVSVTQVPEPNSATLTCSASPGVNRLSALLEKPKVADERVTHVEPLTTVVQSPPDLIEQTTALRDQLRSVVQGLTEVVLQMRQQRKQSRLMKPTLQSLKQLHLLDA